MVKRHLSRLAAPKSWPIKRKGIQWITRPLPGPHALEKCMPIILIVRELLGYAKTSKEVKKILNDGKILVNGRIIKEIKFPVGLFDVIEIPSIKEIYLFLYSTKGKLKLLKLKEKVMISKIIDKKLLKGKKIQLNLHNAQNILVDKDEYKVGDSIILDGTKIKKHLKLEKGAQIYLISGKHIGNTGTLEEIQETKYPEASRVILKIGNEKVETSKECLFVTEKSLLKENE